MSTDAIPSHYRSLKDRFGALIESVETLGATVRTMGPLDDKTTHLIQLAAAAAIRSEGSVHSHARRALEAGATVEELEHTVLVLTSTLGFPAVAAAMSWVDDVTADLG